MLTHTDTFVCRTIYGKRNTYKINGFKLRPTPSNSQKRPWPISPIFLSNCIMAISIYKPTLTGYLLRVS